LLFEYFFLAFATGSWCSVVLWLSIFSLSPDQVQQGVVHC